MVMRRQVLANPPAVRMLGIEMTGDRLFARRVVRLALTSIVALGLIWFLWAATLNTPAIIGIGLVGGWLLMPSILGLSLRWPRLRLALIVPASMESVALLGLCARYLPAELAAKLGWLLITAGVLMGDFLGAWFWFRWLPVPSRLTAPFSVERWVLIGAHVSLILAGIGLVALSASVN